MTFARVPQRVESRFMWQGQYFALFFVAGAALWTKMWCSSLARGMPFCVAGTVVGDALHRVHSTFYSKLHNLRTHTHATLHILNFTIHTWKTPTLPPTLHTLHCALYPAHLTLHIPNRESTLYIPHSTLHTLHHALHFTLRIARHPLHILHFNLCSPHSTLHTLHPAYQTPPFPLTTPHSTICIAHFTLHTSHATSPIRALALHSILCTPHSTLYTLHYSPQSPL